MYEAHPAFIEPPDENIKLWRYLSLSKFISMIASECLFFSRADKLDDTFEGSWPIINVAARLNIPKEIPEESRGPLLEMMKDMTTLSQNMRKHIAVNCWHMNEYESTAMWKLYSKEKEGIAIQTTYDKFKHSFIDKEIIFLGMMKYIDFEKEVIDPRLLMSPFLCKRKNFEHEREVRALIMRIPTNDQKIDLSKENIGLGINIKTKLDTLIEKVFIAPSSPLWFEDVLKSVIDKFGFKFEVQHSKLDEQPLF